MPLTRQRSRARGMTLLEVVAATAVVLMTCLAVTAVTVTAVRAGGRSQHVGRADEALQAEAARLRSLPFFASLPSEWPLTRHASQPSAVGELFPHADEAFNVEGAGYVASGDLAGAYVSSVAAAGATVRRTAWMACCDDGGWLALAPAAVSGWLAWVGTAPPGEALLVRLETEAGAAGAASAAPRTRSLVVVLTALGGIGAASPEGLDDPDGGEVP